MNICSTRLTKRCGIWRATDSDSTLIPIASQPAVPHTFMLCERQMKIYQTYQPLTLATGSLRTG